MKKERKKKKGRQVGEKVKLMELEWRRWKEVGEALGRKTG